MWENSSSFEWDENNDPISWVRKIDKYFISTITKDHAYIIWRKNIIPSWSKLIEEFIHEIEGFLKMTMKYEMK